MAAPTVLILTGPPGVGKTTTARILADRRDRAVHLESDHFFRFIRSGFVEPWLPGSQDQNRVVMGIVGAAAAAYAKAGYFTIVDGIVIPRWFLTPLRDALEEAGQAVAYAALRAPLDQCAARAAGREAESVREPEVVERVWREFADLGPFEGHAIEVGAWSAEEVATHVAERLGDELLLR